MLVALKVCKVLTFGFIEENKTLSYNLLTKYNFALSVSNCGFKTQATTIRNKNFSQMCRQRKEYCTIVHSCERNTQT